MKKIVALVLAMVMVMGLATTAFAATASTTYEGLYVVGTDSTTPAADATKTDLSFFKEVAPKYNKTTGVLESAGVMAYFTDGVSNYTKVGSLTEADAVAFSDAACKKAKIYLADAPVVEYYEATVFTNIGDECDEFDLETVMGDDFDDEMVFYSLKGQAAGVTVVAYADEEGATVLKVGSKFVTATVIGEVTAVEHVAVIEYDKNMKVVNVYCSACDTVALKAANAMSVPKGAVTVDGVANWYWPVKAAATTDSAVESPKTFDAGIAMYVGMSVMAAAGSAVVLKKKD